MRDEHGRRPGSWLYPRGSKENPLLISSIKAERLKEVYADAEAKLDTAMCDREYWLYWHEGRERIRALFPAAFDGAHVLVVKPDYWEEQADNWLKSICRA